MGFWVGSAKDEVEKYWTNLEKIKKYFYLVVVLPGELTLANP